MATVVPWASTSGLTDRTASPVSSTAFATAIAGSAGVESTLTMRPSSSTASVKVPPVSTPTRTRGTYLVAQTPRSPRAAGLRERRLDRESVDEVVHRVARCGP